MLFLNDRFKYSQDTFTHRSFYSQLLFMAKVLSGNSSGVANC